MKPKDRGRAIVVDGKLYHYRVGRGRIAVYGENNVKFVPSCAEVIGVTQDTFERGQWKRTSDGQVTPGLLADWLRRRTAEIAAKERANETHERRNREPNHGT